jgi:penicillin-binding protein 1A
VRIVRLLAALILAGLVTVLAVGATFAVKWADELPDYRELDAYQYNATSVVFARDNQPIGKIAPIAGKDVVSRQPVTLDEISGSAIAAVIAGEDPRFFEHYGFDPLAVARSVFETFFRDSQQGGSTITQQLIRSTILENVPTIERKVKEIMLAVQVERYFTKEEVLAGYLNAVFWGGKLFGVNAASNAYFGKDPINLSLAESVYLVSLLPAANAFYPDFKRARLGMKLRLDRLVEYEWVTQAEADAAWREPIEPRGWTIEYDKKGNVLSAKAGDLKSVTAVSDFSLERAPHFMTEVRRFLTAHFREQVFSEGGLKVYTTLDLKAQAAAEATARRAQQAPVGRKGGLPERGTQLAMVALDPYSGEVLSIVGGLPNAKGEIGQFNRAVQSRRSPGSSIKPLLYATAIESGANQWDTYIDEPLRIPARGTKANNGCPENYWCPKNFEGTFWKRPVMMRESLDHSLNIPTIRIGTGLGTGKPSIMRAFRDKLRLLGFDNVPDVLNPAATIGGLPGDVSPLQMAAAYASFVNGGVWNEPRFIRRIEDASGRVLYPNDDLEPKSRRVWKPETAFIALDMIRGVVNDPASISGRFAVDAQISGRQVGGKTGTSSDQRDLWFVGVTPNIAAAVWIGHDDFAKSMDPRIYSGVYNPPIWHDLVSTSLAGKAPGEFREPANIAYREVNEIKMAYASQATATEATASDPEPDPEPVVRPAGPSVEGPPPTNDGTVLVTLDTCANPPVRAAATTPFECVQQRRVRLADLYLYEPTGQ